MDLRFALGLTALTVFLQSHNWVGPETRAMAASWRPSVQRPSCPLNVVSSGAVDSGVEVCEIMPVRGYALGTCWQRHRWLVRPSGAAKSKRRQNKEKF